MCIKATVKTQVFWMCAVILTVGNHIVHSQTQYYIRIGIGLSYVKFTKYDQFNYQYIWQNCEWSTRCIRYILISVGKPTSASVTPPIRLKTFTQGQIIITHQVSPIIVIGIDVCLPWRLQNKPYMRDKYK